MQCRGAPTEYGQGGPKSNLHQSTRGLDSLLHLQFSGRKCAAFAVLGTSFLRLPCCQCGGLGERRAAAPVQVRFEWGAGGGARTASGHCDRALPQWSAPPRLQVVTAWGVYRFCAPATGHLNLAPAAMGACRQPSRWRRRLIGIIAAREGHRPPSPPAPARAQPRTYCSASGC